MPTEIPETDVDEVLAFYVRCHPRYRPGETARKAVRKALRAGYTVVEIKDAIRGNADDRWCVSVRKFDLPYVLREGIIDQFIEKANPPAPVALTDANGAFTPEGFKIAQEIWR